MKRVLIAVLVCFSGIAGAQNTDGNMWRSMSTLAKVSYVRGWEDGNCAGVAQTLPNLQQSDGKRIRVCLFPVGTSGLEIAARLDRFYYDSKNRSILTAIALTFIKKEMEGTPLTQTVIDHLRQGAKTP